MFHTRYSYKERCSRHEENVIAHVTENKIRRTASEKLSRKAANQERAMTDTTNIEKVREALRIMIIQFIGELQGGLLDIDYTSKIMVMRRKDQLTIFKETMSTLRQLKELEDFLERQESSGAKQDPLSKENVILFNQAAKLLKDKGLKARVSR